MERTTFVTGHRNRCSHSFDDSSLPITHDTNSFEGEVQIGEDCLHGLWIDYVSHISIIRANLEQESVLWCGLRWQESSHQQETRISAADADREKLISSFFRACGNGSKSEITVNEKCFDSQLDRQFEGTSGGQVDPLCIVRIWNSVCFW